MNGNTDTDQTERNNEQCYCVAQGEPQPDWDRHHPDGCGSSAYYTTVTGDLPPLPSEIRDEPFGQQQTQTES